MLFYIKNKGRDLKMDFSTLLKKLDNNLTLIETNTIDNIIYITCTEEIYDATCPFCNEKSNSIHSTYTRIINDLPIQEYQVKLKLLVHKYFCNNPNCQHKTFAERFSFVEKSAVRTKRLTEYIKKIAVRNSSMDTVRDLKDNSIITSVNTVLRILKKEKI